MKRWFALLFAVASIGQVCRAQTGPSLEATFEWMTNTLKPSEGNNVGMHRPFPSTAADEREGIDVYNSEIITGFSQTGCLVEVDVDVVNNGEVLLGKGFDWREVDTFDLKDIDSTSVRIAGEDLAWADDTRGRVVIFKTTNAKPKIHAETNSSSGKTAYAFLHKKRTRRGAS